MRNLMYILFTFVIIQAGFLAYSSITQIEQRPEKRIQEQREEQREQRATKQEVLDAQEKLKNLGFYEGAINGEMDKNTERAIRLFQQDRRLPVTGTIDQKTQKFLERSIDDETLREERLESWMYD